METPFLSTVQAMMDNGIPVAQLSIISLAKLHAKDPAELDLLIKAASDAGIFYLDLRGDSEGIHVLANLPDVYAVAENYFNQPEDAKTKDTRLDIKASLDLGWKKSASVESFEISRDEVASNNKIIPPLPQLFQDNWKKITEFSAGCDQACLTLLSSLSADFMQHHRPNHSSDTGLKLVLHPSSPKVSDVTENMHTDGGTITLLFYRDWSMQAFYPTSRIWAFIPPLEGCALINVADSLQRLSGGKLHSPKHRVTQPFDGVKDRYYLSYYLRPENASIENWNTGK